MKMPAISLTLLVTAVACIARGQTVSYAPNQLGLDIESATVDTQNQTVQIAFHNTSGKPITAYAVNVASVYSDGEQLNYSPSIDFFESIGMERFAAPDHPTGAMQPGGVRTSTFLYLKAETPGAALSSIRVNVVGIIFSDESTAGQPEPLHPALSRRDVESAEILRWCADIDQISRKSVTRKTLDDFVASHMAEGPQGSRPPAQRNNDLTNLVRKEFTSLLQHGMQWQDDGSGLLSPPVADAIDAKCSAARIHTGQKESK